ncbi:hypothetical protein CBA19CS22_00745 [Caballeronia novacaledonica]|uniref:Uncharacterized protein n=1 Tax=Caballeronia novacaledonica TaxID=1544861 RepID=A0ACB5QJ88_9BURK|nr:hypothetical protein CBA19CS22_00745 [Caballeronia novacaledonica]
MMTEEQRAVIRDANSSISASADTLRACHTCFENRDDWGNDHEAKADYDADVALVARLNDLLSASIADTAGAKPDRWADKTIACYECRLTYGESHMLSDIFSGRVAVAAPPAPRMRIETGDFGSDEPPRLVVDAAHPAPSVADAAGASERERFELWCREQEFGDHDLQRNGDNYRFTGISDMWGGWKARALLAAGASEGQTSKPIMRFNIYGNLINPEPNGMYVRYDAHAAEIAALRKERDQALLDAEQARNERNRVGVEIRRELMAESATQIAALHERIAGMEKDAERWHELKEHTRETEIRRGCTASAFGQPNWLLNYGTMDYTLDAYIEIRARKARQDAAIAKEKPCAN